MVTGVGCVYRYSLQEKHIAVYPDMPITASLTLTEINSELWNRQAGMVIISFVVSKVMGIILKVINDKNQCGC